MDRDTQLVDCLLLCRYESERGPDKIQVLAKLGPNCFADGFGADAMVESAVERIRVNVLGQEGLQGALDLLQLHWFEFQVGGQQ